MNFYYMYFKEKKSCMVSLIPQMLPLIKITDNLKESKKVSRSFLIYGEKNLFIRKKHHYGVVIGKVDETTLKCIECVEYQSDFRFGLFNLDFGINNGNINELPYVKVITDEANVEVLEQATDKFNNFGVRIWWNHNMKQESPI